VRVHAVELEDVDGQGIGGVSLSLDGLTVLIGKNGVGKSLILQAIEAVLGFSPVLDRQTRGSDPPVPYGSVHISLDLTGGASDDWSWFRSILARGAQDGDLGSEVPGIGWVLGGPEDFANAEDYEFWLRANEITEAQDQSFDTFVERLFVALDNRDEDVDRWGRSVALLVAALVAEDRHRLAVQVFPGGAVDLLMYTDSAEGRADLENFFETMDYYAQRRAATDADSPGRRLLSDVSERLAEPTAGHVHVIRIGELPHDERLMRDLLERLPSTVHIHDRVHDPEPDVDAAVDKLMNTHSRKGWLETTADGGFVARPEIRQTLARLADASNRLAPSFVTERGPIDIRLAPAAEWLDSDAPRTMVGRARANGEFIGFPMLGAGTRRWVGESVRQACQEITSDDSAGEATTIQGVIYLIDEPEMHLHPLAQRDVLDWIEQRVAEGHSAVVATHSPVFLNPSLSSAKLHALVRQDADLCQFDLSADTIDDLAAVDGLGTALGLDRVMALQVMRGVLVVEGLHDELIIKKFWAADLAHARIRLLALRGTRNASRLIESDLLGSLGVPLCVMFDDVRDDVLESLLGGTEADVETLNPEEAKVRSLLQALRHQQEAGHDVSFVPFPLPDVIAALPMAAIQRAFPGTHAEWSQLISEWRSSDRGRGFKAFALDRLGLGQVHSDDFVKRVLSQVAPEDEPAVELTRAVKTASARLHGAAPTSPAH
jgi:AAA domain, putative AbiEii toxin, Type IV TA system